MNFYLKFKFEVRFLLGPLDYLFYQNVPPEAPHVLAVKIGSVGFRPKVWHQYHDISLLKTFYNELNFEVRFYLGTLGYLFRQNLPPDVPPIPAFEKFMMLTLQLFPKY